MFGGSRKLSNCQDELACKLDLPTGELIDPLEGAVERIGRKLMLCIPLADGGEKLIDCSRGFGRVNGEYLEFVIPAWMAEKLQLREGSFVVVGKEGRGITIQPRDWPPERQPIDGLLRKAYRSFIHLLHKIRRN
jgi:hypothetical protein